MFYVDIETIPDYDRICEFDINVPDLPSAETMAKESVTFVADFLKEYEGALPVEWLVEVEKAEIVNKNRTGVLSAVKKGIEAAEKQKTTLSVTPEYNKIIAMGWAINDGPIHSMIVDESVSENAILEEFWELVKNNILPIVGFNIIGFDIPTIFVRSAMLKVPPTRFLDLRPWGNDVIDLMKARYPWGKAKGLATLCRLYGIENPAPDINGSMIAELWNVRKLDLIRRHVESDIECTRKLHEFFAGYFVRKI